MLAPAAGAVPLARTYTGEEVREAVRHGAFVERGAIISDLDLSDVEVAHPFECLKCTFVGGIAAKDAIFNRRVDLSGSDFDGRVNMEGAAFNGPVIFGAAADPAHFKGPADFPLATFAGLASFEGVDFDDRASFTLARFGGNAIFAALPAGEGVAAAGTFKGPAVFSRALFGAAADFANRVFADDANFTRVDFRAGADFTRGKFKLLATFDGVHFGGDVTFLASRFSEDASILDVRAAGTIDLSAVSVGGALDLEDTTAGAILLGTPTVGQEGELYFSNVSTPDFSLNLNALDDVTSERRETLRLIGTSARTRGDLALANDAQYRLNVIRSRTLSWPVRVGDVVFYRWIAGYLLRPFHPLLALVALALLVSVLRSRFRRAEPAAEAATSAPPPRPKRRARSRRRPADWTAVRAGLDRVGHELLDTLALIWPGGGGKDTGRRFEAVVYRLLFVCMLFGFANSNPTLRQMLDALT